MRYCQRLCDAVNEPSDVEKHFDKMPKEQNSEFGTQKTLVIKGRRDIYHCSTSGGCISVLAALCAASSQLRSLGVAYAAAAGSCDADVLQLLERMQLCDESAFVAAAAQARALQGLPADGGRVHQEPRAFEATRGEQIEGKAQGRSDERNTNDRWYSGRNHR